MPHLNELQTKFEKSGLSILGVTKESAKSTTPWIEKHGVRFPYAFDPSGEAMAQLGARGFPSAVLVDVYGEIVWTGHPKEIDEETIEKALDNQSPVRPLFELEGYSQPIRKALFAEDYKKVYAELEDIEDGEQRAALTGGIERVIDRRLGRLEALFVCGDYLAVSERTKTLGKAFKKLPGEERIVALSKKLKDRVVAKALKAQLAVRKLVPAGARIPDKNRDKIAKKLYKIIEDYPRTGAARDAQDALDWIGR